MALKDDPIESFKRERAASIEGYASDPELTAASARWLELAFRRRYMYNFDWLGRPIIQLPGDMVAFQEVVWQAKPDVIVETGIAHGGSLILSASLLALLDVAEALEHGTPYDPRASRRRVIGVDIDIRAHNRAAIEAHPFSHRITMIQGSSTDAAIARRVAEHASGARRILVCLDSNHTRDHVLAELELYAPLTSPGSYCLVFDTVVEDLPDGLFPDRPWSRGNSPKTAVQEYLRLLQKPGRKAADGAPLHFEVDRFTDDKLLLSAAPGGFLRRR